MSEQIKMNCIICGEEFEQSPHPHTGQAFYYSCPVCRAKASQEFRQGPARDSRGIGSDIKKLRRNNQ